MTFETFIKRGDTPTKKWEADDDLDTATSVKIICRVPDAEVPFINREVDSHAGNIVSVTFTPAETATVGPEHGYNLEIQAQFPERDGPITYPERGYLKLYVTADLGD